MKIAISKNMISVDYKDKSSSFALNWKDSKFDMHMKNTSSDPYSSYPVFDLGLRGTIAPDGSDTRIDISWAGKDVGFLKSTTRGISTQFSMNLALDIDLVKVMFDLSGRYLTEL
jgi:hypothetical protein